MPFFEEMVQWIEENCDARKLNFIVFYLSETLEKGIHEVVYVPTKNFRANLRIQGQKIFSYVGDDMDLEHFELNHKERWHTLFVKKMMKKSSLWSYQ